MSTTQPTESVSGREGWRWNQWRAELEGRRAESSRSAPRQPHERTGQRPTATSAEVKGAHTPTSAAGADLEDREAEYIIEHYERLLAEKDREIEQLREAESPEPSTVVERFLARLGLR